jgi:hypothetical protein
MTGMLAEAAWRLSQLVGFHSPKHELPTSATAPQCRLFHVELRSRVREALLVCRHNGLVQLGDFDGHSTKLQRRRLSRRREALQRGCASLPNIAWLKRVNPVSEYLGAD